MGLPPHPPNPLSPLPYSHHVPVQAPAGIPAFQQGCLVCILFPGMQPHLVPWRETIIRGGHKKRSNPGIGGEGWS